jgi:16S rRNA U516 pseudouridylate synthase RsuA-like enzyme
MKTRAFDVEAFVPQFTTRAAYQISEILSCSRRHVINLIKDGCIKVQPEELALAERKEKPWTTVRVTREALVEFVKERMRPAKM